MAKKIVIEWVDPENYIGDNSNKYRAHYRAVIEPHNPVTKCTILVQHEPIVESAWALKAAGMSICKHGDIYDTETGNRLALKSALRQINNRAQREHFWKLYLEKFPVSERKSQDMLRELAARADASVFIHGLRELRDAIKSIRAEQSNIPY